jgi:hypothetical protein
VLSGITADRPQVASWNWAIPKLPSGDIGHYCIAVFVHSAASPLSDPSLDMDDLARRRKLVGLKNVHLGPALPADGVGGGGPQPEALQMREYIEFHNARAVHRLVALAFDFRRLPPQLKVTIQLSHLSTVQSLANSIQGATPGPLNPSTPPTPIPLDARVYEANSSVEVIVDGIKLAPFEAGAAELVIRNVGSLPPGSEYTFQVQLLVDREVLGGSQYKVRIAGHSPPLVYVPPKVPEFPLRNDPLWARERIEKERERQKKREAEGEG